MDVSRLYLWIPSAALFPLTDYGMSNGVLVVDKNRLGYTVTIGTDLHWYFIVESYTMYIGVVLCYRCK